MYTRLEHLIDESTKNVWPNKSTFWLTSFRDYAFFFYHFIKMDNVNIPSQN